MRRFLKAELGTIFRKPKLYVLLLIMLGGFGLGAIIDAQFLNNGSAAGQLFIQIFYAICAIILVADITHKEYKYGTMKNLIGCGFTRTTIYVGKYITTMIVSTVFILFEKLVKWGYCYIKGDFDSVYMSSDLMDICRQFFLFSLIFVICMVIVSDSISLVISMMYGLVLQVVIALAGAIIFGVASKVMPKVAAVLMLSDSIYIKQVTQNDKVISESIDKGGLIWFFLGIVFVIATLWGGYAIFKKKEVK